MEQTFPVILYPKDGVSPLMSSDGRMRRNKKRGNSELIVQSRVSGLRLEGLKTTVSMRLDGHNYEPDLAFVSKDVCIDIEIDEPYAISGHPTHYVKDDGTNSDSVRNLRFQEAGWHVMRFSEEQFFCHTLSCMKEVCRVLLSAGAIDAIPNHIADAPDLMACPRWDETDSKRLKCTDYRPSYLGFNPARMNMRDKVECCRLIVPVIFRSMGDSDLRREMFFQLKNFVKYQLR